MYRLKEKGSTTYVKSFRFYNFEVEFDHLTHSKSVIMVVKKRFEMKVIQPKVQRAD